MLCKNLTETTPFSINRTYKPDVNQCEGYNFFLQRNDDLAQHNISMLVKLLLFCS